MKGDFSRRTFIQEKHYSGVLMQQGRVQIDADWNEQHAIQLQRVETEAGDVIGPCGAPEDAPGFCIAPLNTSMPGTVTIGKGRYYVDGILCENEADIKYEDQDDLDLIQPVGVAAALEKESKNTGIVYLDVWRRHITALEDPYIREKALGGPDTATREKTVWQVRVAPIALSLSASELVNLTTLLTNREQKQAQLKTASGAATINTLLSDLADLNKKIYSLIGKTTCDGTFPEWDEAIAAGTGKLNARSQPTAESKDPCILAAEAGYRRLENQLYRVEIHEAVEIKNKVPTKNAVFKWSRDNGSIVSGWSGQSGPNNEYLTIDSPGKDSVLGFAADQWIELTDDKHELDGTPGTLVRVVKVEGQTVTIDPSLKYPSTGSVKYSDFSYGPKVRRWDGKAKVEIPSANGGWLELEDGVEILFSNGTYKTGDYWMIPARTDGGDIEWPPFKSPNTSPTPQYPMGIQHHYCRLALVLLDSSDKLHVLEDCREIFPPLTQSIHFYFSGGDGQEAMPDPTKPSELIKLAEKLRVGVSDWRFPVAGANVLFRVSIGSGKLKDSGSDDKVILQTDADGIAACTWRVDSTHQDQTVEAFLLDKNNAPMQTPIRFHANLSTADKVSYKPGNCGYLNGVVTVQDAITKLCQRESGKSCCVTVGKNGGQYDTLDKAVAGLQEQGQSDMCLCLLPGEHDLNGLSVDGKDQVNLKIVGAGPGTRIKSTKAWEIQRLQSFTMRDVRIDSEGVDKLFAFDKCGDIALESCRVKQTGAAKGGFLGFISNADRIRLAGNFLESYLETKSISIGSAFKGLDDQFLGLSSIRDPEKFKSQATDAAAHIAGLSKTARQKIAADMKKNLQDAKIGSREQLGYNILAELITADTFKTELVTDALLSIRATADEETASTALVIADNHADAVLSRNRIQGLVSLYGLPDDTAMTTADLDHLAQVKKVGPFSFSGSGRAIWLTGNQLTRLAVGKDIRKIIKDTVDQIDQPGILPNLFASCTFSDNVLSGAGTILAAQNVATASNTWLAAGPNSVLMETKIPSLELVIADTAAYTGNLGQARLFDMSKPGKSKEAANLIQIYL
jgi:hypothetical protein